MSHAGEAFAEVEDEVKHGMTNVKQKNHSKLLRTLGGRGNAELIPAPDPRRRAVASHAQFHSREETLVSGLHR